jgi:hypothetical protein
MFEEVISSWFDDDHVTVRPLRDGLEYSGIGEGPI